ncbi:MAG: shikimate kinase [Saprospiraceae bacterium]|nr:shikimate kinase [Saprospiraceae bacterium]
MTFRIFLTGFMGSGKSHTGRLLGEALGIPFVDLDDWIEKQEGQSIAEIFAASGEAAFRKIEQNALRSMHNFDFVIVSCGGGTPCFFDNMDWMKEHGITVYLQIPAAELCRRLIPEMAHRPLLKGLNELTMLPFIEEKLALREPYYLQSQIITDSPGALIEILAELNRQIRRLVSKNDPEK